MFIVYADNLSFNPTWGFFLKKISWSAIKHKLWFTTVMQTVDIYNNVAFSIKFFFQYTANNQLTKLKRSKLENN